MKTKESTLYYFYSIGCAFCNKIEPIVDKLNSNGYNIIKLDTSEKDNYLFKQEVLQKFKLQCGTPFLVDSETGNAVCGWRNEETIKKWADGEKIPEPPKPKTPAPILPKDFFNDEEVDKFIKEYEIWAEKNKHISGLQTPEQIVNKFKQGIIADKKRKESVEGRLETIESNLKKLMNHLGVK